MQEKGGEATNVDLVHSSVKTSYNRKTGANTSTRRDTRQYPWRPFPSAMNQMRTDIASLPCKPTAALCAYSLSMEHKCCRAHIKARGERFVRLCLSLFQSPINHLSSRSLFSVPLPLSSLAFPAIRSPVPRTRPTQISAMKGRFHLWRGRFRGDRHLPLGARATAASVYVLAHAFGVRKFAFCCVLPRVRSVDRAPPVHFAEDKNSGKQRADLTGKYDGMRHVAKQPCGNAFANSTHACSKACPHR